MGFLFITRKNWFLTNRVHPSFQVLQVCLGSLVNQDPEVQSVLKENKVHHQQKEEKAKLVMMAMMVTKVLTVSAVFQVLLVRVVPAVKSAPKVKKVTLPSKVNPEHQLKMVVQEEEETKVNLATTDQKVLLAVKVLKAQ